MRKMKQINMGIHYFRSKQRHHLREHLFRSSNAMSYSFKRRIASGTVCYMVRTYLLFDPPAEGVVPPWPGGQTRAIRIDVGEAAYCS